VLPNAILYAYFFGIKNPIAHVMGYFVSVLRVEFATAAPIRPEIVGATLRRIAEEPELASVMFDILECQQIIEGEARITLLPKGRDLLAQLLATTVKQPASSHRGP
jgi:hypothetical protein